MICRKIRKSIVQGLRKGTSSGVSILVSKLPRKTSKVKHSETVPKTDTGGKVEKTKANE